MITLFLVLAQSAWAATAPAGMTQFNSVCPAARACPDLEDAYEKCKPKRGRRLCLDFIVAIKQLTPPYDCQRPFDHTEKVDYIVPALWLCDHGTRLASLELLSKLKEPEAKRFFASKEFRTVLDGETADLYYDKSVQLEKQLARP